MTQKTLRTLTALALVSGALVALIPGDPKNAVLLGLSTSRAILLAGFLVLAVLFGAGAAWLNSRPKRLKTLESWLEQGLQRSAWQTAVPALAGLLIWIALLHLAQWLLTTDAYQKAILLRLLPVSVFAGGTGGLIFSLVPFRLQIKRWLIVIALALLFMAASRIMQDYLLATIERPYIRDAGLQQASLFVSGLAAFGLLARLSGRSRRDQLTWGWLAALLLALYLIQWVTYPQKYWPSLRNLALAGPLIVSGGTLVALSIFDLWERFSQTVRARLHQRLQIGALICLALLVTPFLQASFEHSRVLNYSQDFVDQAEYLEIARTASLQNFQTTGDHNRMPLYPFFLALFYRPGMSATAFFETGKTVNIWLSLVLLALIFLFVKRYLSWLQTAFFTALAAFSLYIFKAAYIQSESVYYLLALVGFVWSARMLIQPELKLALATGIIFGLAHLTKASILPGLLLFAALFLVKSLAAAAGEIRRAGFGQPVLRSLSGRLGLLAVTLVCFLAVIFPYIRAMKAQFGHYFYNVNTTFYIWYDSNAEAIAAEARDHFAQAWPDHLSPDELPGPAKYLREHSPAQILARIKSGVQAQANNLLEQFSVTNYQLSYLVVLIFAFLGDLPGSLRLIRRYRYIVLFAGLYFVGYLAAFVWYSPISPERRFTYGLYLPFLFSAFVALRAIARQAQDRQPGSGPLDIRRFIQAAHFIIFATLPFNIYFVVVERMLFDRYGS